MAGKMANDMSTAELSDADLDQRRASAGDFRSLTAMLKRRRLLAALNRRDPRQGPAAAAAPLRPSGPGEAAEQLLDVMWGAVNLPPQERSLAGDTLLLLLPRLSPAALAQLALRVAAMDQPPPLLVSRLVRDPRPQIGGVVLERSASLDRAELLAVALGAGPERLRLLARRRSVPAEVADQLVAFGDLASLVDLLRNPGAEISFDAFLRLVLMAEETPALQAPLATRPDLPLAVALDLMWRLPPELRRVVSARFLSDTVTLGRILAIGLAVREGPAVLDAPLPAGQFDEALAPLLAGAPEEAARRLAAAAGLAPDTVLRIFADREGEALVVLLKALGLSRSRFDAALDRLRAVDGLIKPGRPPEELKAVFDSLSFTKARVLLIYWDWRVLRAGPYAAAAGLVEPGPLA